ncbi:MAG: carbohydrate kinase family protein [Candidatus Nanoarchaeia archaeon]
MGDIKILTLSNLLTDVVVKVSLQELEELNFSEGEYKTKQEVDFKKFLNFIENKNCEFIQGGSPANVAFNVNFLGAKSSIIGTLGYDKHGTAYLEYMEKQGIKHFVEIKKGSSGVCYALIGPEGERTFVSDMGVSADFKFNLSGFEIPKIFHTSTYELVSNPEQVTALIKFMKDSGAKISFDLADPSTVLKMKKELSYLLPLIDFLFMTEQEADALTGGENPLQALKHLGEICEVCILKLGKKGSLIREKGKLEEYKISVFPVNVVNTNGAGDAYVSGFLFAYLQGRSINECGVFASEFASRICADKKPHMEK